MLKEGREGKGWVGGRTLSPISFAVLVVRCVGGGGGDGGGCADACARAPPARIHSGRRRSMPSSLADQPSSRQPAHRATDRPTDCLYLTRTLQLLLLLLLLSLNYLRTADTSHHITSPANKVIQFISCCRVPRQSIVMRHHPFLITAAVALMALVYSTAGQ